MDRRFRRVRVWSLLSSTIALLSIAWLLSALLGALLLHAQSAGDFTVVVLTDTQFYSQTYPQVFDSQTQWVANNAAAQNIQLVIEWVDIVNVCASATERGMGSDSDDIL